MTSRVTGCDESLYTALRRRGMSRRAFLQFAAAMAATLALPAAYGPRIARALETASRLPVIWLRGQACDGNTEAFLQATAPTVSQLVLDLLSIDYHEALMAPSGAAAELSRTSTMEAHAGRYIAIVEGGIPTAEGGTYCMIGGRPFSDVAREVCDGALATIAVGSCAFDGGLPAASGGPTGSVGIAAVASGGTIVALPGCPLNVENLVATIVHYLTFEEWPATDMRGRPLFAYGGLIHNQCERRAQFEFGQFVLAWGDEGAQKGWCLYKMGCKGPEAFANCPTEKFGDDISWPIRAGHGCVGCTMPGFWDQMSPFYRRLPSPLPFAREVTTDQIGLAVVGGIAAVVGVHGAASYVRSRRGRRPAAAIAGADGSSAEGVDERPSREPAVASPSPAVVEPQAAPAELPAEPAAPPSVEEPQAAARAVAMHAAPPAEPRPLPEPPRPPEPPEPPRPPAAPGEPPSEVDWP